MDVSLVIDEVTLEPDVPGEILLDVVNTDDVIDALEVSLAGAPGASVQVAPVPTLFPGERRRLPLQVRLPSQTPAGRHYLDVLVRTSATQQERQAKLIVDVGSRPALAAAAHPSVRKARRSARFPLTIANRGNTTLRVRPQVLDAPDGVKVSVEPEELVIEPWQTCTCPVTVTGPRHILGATREHLVDLRAAARSSTPGQPFLEQELLQDVRITFRQRPILSSGTLLTLVLVAVLLLWATLGYAGLRAFVRSEALPLATAPGFSSGEREGVSDDAGVTISGTVLSQVDGSPASGVTVLACSRDPQMRQRRCARDTADYQTLTDTNGRFWLASAFPGPYRLRFLPNGNGGPAVLPVAWYDASCDLVQRIPGRPGDLTLLLVQPAAATPAQGPLAVQVEAQVAPTATATANPSPTPTPSVSIPAGRCPMASAPGVPPLPLKTPTPENATSSTTHPFVATGVATPGVPGSWRAELKLAGLPAPGHYDLTITAGTSVMKLCRVPVEPSVRGQEQPPLRVEFDPDQLTCPGAP